MLYKVKKRFDADEGSLRPGDVVDPRNWRNLAALIEHRFIEPADTDAKVHIASLEEEKTAPAPVVNPPAVKKPLASRKGSSKKNRLATPQG